MNQQEDPRWPYAQHYVKRGWRIFVLGKAKTPLPNCSDCARADWHHDREKCSCLVCHGFYAATTSLKRLTTMLSLYPDGLLALRCGPESGVLVLDFERSGEPGEPTGLEVLEQWQQWTGEEWDLPQTMKAWTARGGIHLFYEYPAGPPIPMRNRILPSTDLKADKGYVALPCGIDSRHWADDTITGEVRGIPSKLPTAAVDWLRNARGRRAGGHRGRQLLVSVGYDYQRCLAEGPRHGERDEFWNDYLFRMRKTQMSQHDAFEFARATWSRFGGDADVEDPFPFEWIEYKIQHVWQTVAPDEAPVRNELEQWAQRQTGKAVIPTMEERQQRFIPVGHYVKTVANPTRKQL